MPEVMTSKAADMRAGKAIIAGMFLAVLLISVLPYLVRSGSLGSEVAGLASLSIFLCLLPWLVWAAGLDPVSLPVFPVFCGFLAVFFAAAPFLVPLGWPDGNIILYEILYFDGVDPATQRLLLYGILAILAGYYGAIAGPLAGRSGLQLPRTEFGPWMRVMLWCMGVVHLAYLYIPAVQTLPSAAQLLDPVGFMAVGGLYLAWRRGKLAVWEKAALVLILVPLMIYSVVKVLLITKIFLLGIFMFLLFMYERQFKFVVITGLAGLLLLASYRYTTSYRNFEGVGIERIKAVVSAIIEDATSDELINPRTGLVRLDIPPAMASLIRRIGQYWVFQHVARTSPEIVPYWHGYSLKPLLTAPVPRVLYPDKPIEDAGRRFGYRYGILKSSDIRTSVNIPWPTELLANFGPGGMVAGMGLIGIVMAGVLLGLVGPNAGNGNILLGATVLHPLAYPESNISVTTGSMPLLFLVLLLAYLLALWLDRRSKSG